MIRQHKIVMLKYAKGKLWVLIFPLLRSLILLKFNFYYWVKGTYLDIFVILFLLGTAYLKWRCVCFETNKKGIYVKSGLLKRSELTLPYSKITCAEARKFFLLRPFGAVEISLYSCSSAAKKAAITIIATETFYKQLFNIIPNEVHKENASYKASKKETLFFSLLFSSALSGSIFILALITKGGELVGKNFEKEIILVLSKFTKKLTLPVGNVKPIVAVITAVVILGWLVAFAKNWVGNINFKTRRCGKNIFIEKGHFSVWKYYVNYSSINYVDLQQSLLMRATKIMSVKIGCVGYEWRHDGAILVPIASEKRVKQVMTAVLPDFTESNISIKTKRGYIAYMWLPLVPAVAVPIGAAVLGKAFPEWRDTAVFFGAMLELPMIYLLAASFAARHFTGIGLSGEAVTLRYCRLLRFHTVIMPKGRIAYVKIRRTIFQRVSGCCDVIIYAGAVGKRGHFVRGIQFDAAKNLASKYDKIG